jgi:hypothetical protein
LFKRASFYTSLSHQNLVFFTDFFLFLLSYQRKATSIISIEILFALKAKSIISIQYAINVDLNANQIFYYKNCLIVVGLRTIYLFQTFLSCFIQNLVFRTLQTVLAIKSIIFEEIIAILNWRACAIN